MGFSLSVFVYLACGPAASSLAHSPPFIHIFLEQKLPVCQEDPPAEKCEGAWLLPQSLSL